MYRGLMNAHWGHSEDRSPLKDDGDRSWLARFGGQGAAVEVKLVCVVVQGLGEKGRCGRGLAKLGLSAGPEENLWT